MSQRLSRCGILAITLAGDHSAEYALSGYHKMGAVEKLFTSFKTFIGEEPVRVHGMDALRERCS
jgi:hypothetical protein